MDRPAIKELSAYIDWTWRQYDATIRPLGDEALTKLLPGSGWPALRDALAHINWAYDRWIADPARTSDIAVEPVNSWADAEAFRRRVRGRFREYLDSLTDDELITPREMNIDGEMMSYSPADILTLLLLHEREHHGDINTLLYHMGVEAPQLSYRFFLLESRESLT
jgi:uncharacterized damage-inducible protein DinB